MLPDRSSHVSNFRNHTAWLLLVLKSGYSILSRHGALYPQHAFIAVPVQFLSIFLGYSSSLIWYSLFSSSTPINHTQSSTHIPLVCKPTETRFVVFHAYHKTQLHVNNATTISSLLPPAGTLIFVRGFGRSFFSLRRVYGFRHLPRGLRNRIRPQQYA